MAPISKPTPPITSKNITQVFSTGKAEYSDDDIQRYPIIAGSILDVNTQSHSCKVLSESGMILGDVKWASPGFSCGTGSGVYIMPHVGASVLLGRAYGGNWYIIGFLPKPDLTEGASSVNGRKQLQHGDVVMSTSAGNFVEIRNSGEMIHLKNTQNCEMIMESTQNKIAHLCQRYLLRTDAGSITMTSSASGSTQGETLTDIYLEKKVWNSSKVDSSPNFVRLSIGSLSSVSGVPSHSGLPQMKANGNDVILLLNVCDLFKLSIDVSGNIKISGNSMTQEFISDITRRSGNNIVDSATVNIDHQMQLGNIGEDLGGDSGSSGVYDGLKGFLGTLDASAAANKSTIVEGPPGSTYQPGRKSIGMGGNGAYGGKGGYHGDDGPGGHKDSHTTTPYTPLTAGSNTDKLIDYTARNEGGGKYDAWTANDNGHGVSYGLVQFNQQTGALPTLMQQMHDKNPTKFNEIFGDNSSNMLNEKWVRNANLNDPTVKQQMLAAARDPEFQEVQRSLANQGYMTPATNTANEFNVKSERSRAMLFDSCVQNGPGGTHELMTKAARGGGSEKEIMTRFAALADNRKYSNNRRTKILNDSNLSDNEFTP